MLKHSKKTAWKLTTATAIAALAFGVAPAGAQGLSSSSDLAGVVAHAPNVPDLNVADYVDVDRVGQLNATVLGGASADAAAKRAGQSRVLTALPHGAQPLPKDEAKAAVVGTLQAVKSAAMTVELRGDGTLTYDDGCNSGNGVYTVDERGLLHVGELSETRVMCESATMDNAADLKQVLQSTPAVYRLDNGNLALGSQGKAIEFAKAVAEK